MKQTTTKILVWIFSIFIFHFSLFANEAILSIDSGGHTALIRDIIVTKSGDIISASDDKSIRVWSGRTGSEKRKILGNIGAGDEGMIFAIALSPDERYLAVGGYLGGSDNESKSVAIRLYDYQSGKLLTLLKSHKNIINDLAFSPDGGYLASGSADKTVKLWNMRTLSLARTIEFHTKQVYAVKFASNNTIISAGYDNRIALHTLGGEIIGKPYTHSEKLQYIATNGKTIATCGDGNEILLFDMKLGLIDKIKSETVPTGLSYSPNGRYLIAGFYFEYQKPNDKVNVYDSQKGYAKISTFDKHTNLTKAVAWLDNESAISGGGNNNEIYIWNIKTKDIKTKIVGAGQSVWSVGIDGDNIAWGNVFDIKEINNLGSLQKSFNLKTLATTSVTNQSSFKRINSEALTHSKGGDYGYGDAVLTINSSGVTITKDAYTGYAHNCYGWYKDYIISGGSNSHLKIYNSKGVEVASLVGHTGEIWSIALDGDRLVSGSSDQTIKVWDLKGLKSESGKSQINPTLSIFVGSDNEWVMWTPEGFFDASKNGAKYIGYHINQGANKEAEFVGVDKLYSSLYRPDLIEKALAGESLASYAKEINIARLLEGGLAPKVEFVTQSGKTDKKNVELELKVCDNGGGYDNLTLFLNGTSVDVISKDRAIKANSIKKSAECIRYTKPISLGVGENIIGFRATNRTGTIESNTPTINITYKSSLKVKPNLYVLSLAIDKYRDGDLRLNYSNADGDAMVGVMQKVGKGLFGNIFVYKLRDGDVTKENIQKIFGEVGAKTTREDVFVLHIAGHGITDPKSGEYFYLPADFRYKNEDSIRSGGFSQKEFAGALSKIQAMKSISLLDTCNSGSFAEALASRGILQKTALDKLTRATGRATIVASSKDQVAMEGYNGHGVFTYTLVEALDGKAYKDGKITIKQLAAYVEDVLPDRTFKRWGFEQMPQSNITGTDFPIGVK